MYRVNFLDSTISRHSQTAPIRISADDARQGDMAHNSLHVLGFGLAGAILANALMLVFFTLS